MIDEARARAFCTQIMQAYGFQPAAVDLVLQMFLFEVKNWANTTGGGLCHPPKLGGGIKGLVELEGIQHEGAVHECSHAFWFGRQMISEVQLEREAGWMLDAALVEADLPPLGRYAVVRELCHGYKYGKYRTDGSWWPGLRDSTFPCGWNWIEIHGGLCSGTMGKMWMMPETLWLPPVSERKNPKRKTLFQRQFGERLEPSMTVQAYLPAIL